MVNHNNKQVQLVIVVFGQLCFLWIIRAYISDKYLYSLLCKTVEKDAFTSRKLLFIDQTYLDSNFSSKWTNHDTHLVNPQLCRLLHHSEPEHGDGRTRPGACPSEVCFIFISVYSGLGAVKSPWLTLTDWSNHGIECKQSRHDPGEAVMERWSEILLYF